ncbi:MAG: cell wall-binding repeat-containing protein [Romboutsia sp.]
MIKKAVAILSLISVMVISSITDVYAQDGYNNIYIEGSPQEISLELNKEVFKNADEVFLVSEELSTDALSLTPLAYAKDAPILTVEWKKLSKEFVNYLRELGVKKVTLIGGINLISRTTEQQLMDMGYEVERIKGSGPFQRSRKIANLLSEEIKVKKAIVVNSKSSGANALAVASYAAQNNMALILSDDRYMSETVGFLNKKGYKEIYAIGNSERFIKHMTEKSDTPSVIIKEITRQDMNIKIIKDTYKNKSLDSIYTANTDYDNYGKIGDYISLGLVSAKQDIPILICLENYSYSQKKFLEESSVKNIITVGKTVGDYSIKNALTNKSFMSTIALIVLLLIMAIKGFKS